MNEQKIREAFNRTEPNKVNYSGPMFIYFRAGYLALLNELEYVGKNNVEKLYRLPKGVEKP